MSSATPTNVAKSRDIVRNLPELKGRQNYGDGGSGPADSLNERQKRLDYYWRYYRCVNYDNRTTDWNGHPVVGQFEVDMIGQSGVIPPGFYDAGATPLKFRRPSVPYYLAKVIVNRFSGLLFGKKRTPIIVCDDKDTQNWLEGFAQVTGLWSKALQTRNYGGAQGAVAMGFKFLRGQPYVEVHDARWCTPTFADRSSLTVESLEKRYQYVEHERAAGGQWEDVWYWYRRIVTAEEDVIWEKVPVRDEYGELGEPNWTREAHKRVRHGFGECPIVWIQNVPNDEDVDGDPDCYGVYDIIHAIDELWSQAHRGTKASCDPTVGITSDATFESVNVGTGVAIQVEKGGSIDYLEMTGAGIAKAMELANNLEEKALTIARCMLDRNQGGPARAVAEVEHNYSSMTEQADVLRTQYGEQGVARLLEMVLRAARKMEAPRMEVDDLGVTAVTRMEIRLPKRVVKSAELKVRMAELEARANPSKTRPPLEVSPESSRPHYAERVLGLGESVQLKWPDYFTPGLQEIGLAVGAAGQAYSVYNILDLRNAVEFIAPYLGIEDVEGALLEIAENRPPSGVPGGDLNNLMAGLTRPAGTDET